MNYKSILLAVMLLPVSVVEAKKKNAITPEEIALVHAIESLGLSLERFAKILEKLSQQIDDGIAITHYHCDPPENEEINS